MQCLSRRFKAEQFEVARMSFEEKSVTKQEEEQSQRHICRRGGCVLFLFPGGS